VDETLKNIADAIDRLAPYTTGDTPTHLVPTFQRLIDALVYQLRAVDQQAPLPDLPPIVAQLRGLAFYMNGLGCDADVRDLNQIVQLLDPPTSGRTLTNFPVPQDPTRGGP
jgi:hypothetical protein